MRCWGSASQTAPVHVLGQLGGRISLSRSCDELSLRLSIPETIVSVSQSQDTHGQILLEHERFDESMRLSMPHTHRRNSAFQRLSLGLHVARDTVSGAIKIHCCSCTPAASIESP